MAKQALDKVTQISPEVMSKIIWGVLGKFRHRHPNEFRAIHGEKGNSNLLIIADIFLYINTMYSTSDENNKSIDSSIISTIAEFSKSTYGEFYITDKTNSLYNHPLINEAHETSNKIKVSASNTSTSNNGSQKPWKKVVELSSFQKLVSAANLFLVYKCMDTHISCNIPTVQLEVLCLYGWDKTYKQLHDNKDFYKRKDKIRFIPTDLRTVFEPSLQSVLNAFKKADEKGGSEKILNRACEIFTKETARLCADFSKGKIPTQDYLKDLMYSMEVCDCGFGISIPKFSINWETDKGKDILKMNKRQAERFLDSISNRAINDPRWIRIFLVEGDKNNNKKLSNAESKMLKAQLENDVKVFVVFKDAWKDIEEKELELCDFAVFRIDNSPTLMSTQFANGEADGVFYTDESMPESHYNNHLAKILQEKNGQHIYKPNLINNKVVLGNPLEEYGLKGLVSDLEKIYKKSK